MNNLQIVRIIDFCIELHGWVSAIKNEWEHEIIAFERKATEDEIEEVFSIKSVETNNLVNALNSGDITLKEVPLKNLYGITVRLHNSLDVLKKFDPDDYIPLFLDDGTSFQSAFQMACLGLEHECCEHLIIPTISKDSPTLQYFQ